MNGVVAATGAEFWAGTDWSGLAVLISAFTDWWGSWAGVICAFRGSGSTMSKRSRGRSPYLCSVRFISPDGRKEKTVSPTLFTTSLKKPTVREVEGFWTLASWRCCCCCLKALTCFAIGKGLTTGRFEAVVPVYDRGWSDSPTLPFDSMILREDIVVAPPGLLADQSELTKYGGFLRRRRSAQNHCNV